MSTVITNSIVNFVVQQSKGNEKSIHHNLCELGKVPTDSVICTSLAWKAKCVTKEITRLKKYTDRSLLRNYLKETFCFPVSRSRQPNRNQLEKENLQLKGRIIILENELTKAEKKGKEQKLRELNRKIKRDRHTIIRQKEELSKLKKRKSALSETSTQCDLLDLQRKNQILSLKQQLSALEFELSEKEEQPVEKKNDIDFDIRENSKGRPYNPKLRELYYVFRSCNVPCHHTNKLICAVLDLVHIDLCKDDLPSPTLIKQFTYEMGTVAAQQLKEELATASNLTMHRDATTKKGHHYYGVEFSTGEKTLTAGIRETCDAKATTYVNATEHIMDTIDSSATILENVSTYMTDRSSTECKVNTLLTEKTDHDIREMKCAAHPVLNLSEVCEKWMKEFENQVQIPNKLSFCSKSEGIVYTFIKVVSKLFFKDGSGDPKFARLYMEQKGLDIPLLNFRGNRFNILFHNAAGVIVLASEIQEYLESAKCTINRSQNFILQCLQCPNIINVCIALGIIFRIILNPYWTIVSAAKAKAIDMGPVYNFLTAVLQNAIDDPESLVMNRLRLLPGPCNKLEGDALFNVEHENNEVLKNAVKGLCSAMHGKCLSLFKDFISGGKYTNIDMSSAESCPATNITNERLFARLDNKKHTAPTMTTAAIEATIMYSGNKTAEWLSDKNISDKIQIIGNAVKSKKQHMKQISLENEHLKQQNVQVIEERKKIVTKRQEKVKNANDILTYDLESIGLWCSADVVEQELQQLKTKKDKLSALKKQLNMDKEIFNIQEKDKNLLFVSKKGKPISLEIIKEHHLKLIEIYHSQLDVDIVGKLIKHTWSDSSGEETVWKGKVLSCDKGVFKDFFTDGLWDRFPKGWTEGLSQLDPPNLAFLLDSSLPIPNRKDLPLTLLAFRESTHALSLDRQKVDLDNDGVGEGLFPADADKEKKTIVSPQSGVTAQTQARADIQYGQYLPLNACFRAHVKPKKQHEILQLGKAIQLLGSQCNCDHVVDVGAGKGHLSRLLAFGYGFKVTTVEAAGCHAPKAQKMDKAFQRKIHRALKRKSQTDQDLGIASLDGSKEDLTASSKTSLPDHVTCLIQPGTSAGKFLEIVKDSYKKQTNVLDVEVMERVPSGDPSNLLIGSRSPDSESCSNYLSSEKTISQSFGSPDRDTGCMDSLTTPSDKVETTTIQPKGPDIDFVGEDTSNTRPGLTAGNADLSQSRSPVPSDRSKARSPVPVDLCRFVLTGLHACGDLTPTMLRIFAQCPDIVGVASVACCYMKLSCREGEAQDNNSDLGYPMSQFTRDLSDSHLSFEAREMACHFADSYKERLIANPPSLKLHCYRAALQYVIRQTHPGFKQGSIRLTIKHAETLSFESYVTTGLQRLGLDTSVPAQVLQQAQSYLPYWQNVVAFYTLRLSLAPVVESLILLDRMLYLYEQGIPSVLLPIFDPALSPRNFVLLASRKHSIDINTSS